MTNTMTTTSVRLSGRENGPKRMSNGGFACGTFAGLVGGTAKVTLHRKVPLETDLSAQISGVRAQVWCEDRLIAVAEAAEPFVLEPPVRPTAAQAESARERHPLRGVRHPLSDCVVCGPERRDGLGVTPGPLETDPDILAAPFRPTAGYAVDGLVRRAAIWGALDCPSYAAADLRARRFCLLGSLEAHQARPVEVTESLVVVGWTREVGNRSVQTASAMIDEDGGVVASARAVWVAVRHQWAVKTVARFVG
ncbi:hypothetical protein ACVW00_002820 [Marmoricola sp. URHA0025 HA25]